MTSRNTTTPVKNSRNTTIPAKNSRNTTIPVKKKIKYRTSKDNQHAVSIKVFEGASDNNLLGSFTLSGFPSAPRRHLFEVCFAIDEKDVLTVSAGNRSKITIKNEKGKLSTEEIKRMIQDGKRFQVEDDKFRRKAKAKNDLEKYVFKVRNYLTEAQNLLRGNEDDRSKRCLQEMEKIASAIREARSLLHSHNQQDEAEAFLDCLKKLKTSSRNMSDRSISHISKMKRGCPSHKQPLQYISSGEPYMCSGCLELGFGPSYRCKECNHILHDECADPVSNATHPLLPRSKFKFYETAPGPRTRYCDACGKDVRGFVYHCSKTGSDLHPCCLKLKGSLSVEQGHVKLELSQKVPSKCGYCERTKVVEGVKGWSYVSSDDKKCCYHVSCVKELVLKNWKMGRFSQENTSSIGRGSGTDRERSQLALGSIKKDNEMVKSGRRTRRSGKIKMYTKIAVVLFKLIFSAIFGNPIYAVAALGEALFTD